MSTYLKLHCLQKSPANKQVLFFFILQKLQFIKFQPEEDMRPSICNCIFSTYLLVDLESQKSSATEIYIVQICSTTVKLLCTLGLIDLV